MKLTDAKATPQAQALYDLLVRLSGSHILIAQQECPGSSELQMDHLLKTTGKLPAIRGMDFMHNDFQGTVRRAIRWHQSGGIVSICWHTGVIGTGYAESQQEIPDFDALLTPGTPEYALLMSRWQEAADALLQLQDAGVPVLWRPFHEFDGGWFWWGKGGPDVFIRLWKLMYRTFTEVCGLHNLIWVLGYCGEVKPGWYPGDDCCDILGSDTYDITVHAQAYGKLRELNSEKPLAFHECGTLPRVDDLFSQRVGWSWLMPWHSRWLLEDNPPELLQAWYHDPRVITLDKLPDVEATKE